MLGAQRLPPIVLGPRSQDVSGHMVRVNSISGSLCAVSADPSWKVCDLKAAIEASSSVPVRQQRLINGVQELKDTDVLPVDGVEDGCADLLLVRRSPEQVKWLAAVRECWTRFLDVPHALRGDFEIAEAAVSKQGSMLRYVSEDLRADRRIVLAAVRQDGKALQHVAPCMLEDREVVLEAVSRDGCALSFVPPAWRGDRDIVLSAVLQRPAALQYAAPAARGIREVVIAAVRAEGVALKYASDDLRSDVEVVCVAVKQNKKAFLHAGRKAKLHPDVLNAMGLGDDSD